MEPLTERERDLILLALMKTSDSNVETQELLKKLTEKGWALGLQRTTRMRRRRPVPHAVERVG